MKIRWYTKVIRTLQGFWHGFLKGVFNRVGRSVLSYLTTEGVELARDLIKEAEDSGASGRQKFTDVFNSLNDWSKNKGRDIPKHILNTAIEVLVSDFKGDK